MTTGFFTVRVTSITTVAGSRSVKRTLAASRKPSSFGLIVVSSRVSPAYGFAAVVDAQADEVRGRRVDAHPGVREHLRAVHELDGVRAVGDPSSRRGGRPRSSDSARVRAGRTSQPSGRPPRVASRSPARSVTSTVAATCVVERFGEKSLGVTVTPAAWAGPANARAASAARATRRTGERLQPQSDGYAWRAVQPLKTSSSYVPTGDQPQAIERLVRRHPRGRALPDAPRRDRHRQDGDDGLDHRAGAAAGARDRAQQDARRAALQRVPGVLPVERRRVLRLLLRLLPARGVRPAGRPLHREGQLAERRHRPAAPRGDVEPALAARHDHRRVGVVHLRPRLAGGVREEDRLPERRRGDRPRPRAAEADRHPVRPQRHAARPRALPREGRHGRDPAVALRDGVPRLVLRRRGRADHALRSAHRRGALEARLDHRLPGDAVRHVEADDRPRARRDPRRSSRSR